MSGECIGCNSKFGFLLMGLELVVSYILAVCHYTELFYCQEQLLAQTQRSKTCDQLA